MQMDYQEEEHKVDGNFQNVTEDVIMFLRDFFNGIKSKVQSREGNQLLDLALVNLSYHPLLPKTNCIIEFRWEDITYSVDYTDYKIELSIYNSIDTGMGWDHYQSFRHCYYPSGIIECDGDLDEFIMNINQALKMINELVPSEN